MSRRVVGAVLFLILAGAMAVPLSVLGGSAGPGPVAPDGVADAEATPPEQPLLALAAREFDRTLYSIRVFANGSARWTFQYTRELANESEREHFETYAATFRENETDLYRGFVERAKALTRAGTNATGRAMNATHFARDARVSPFGNTGSVEMSFTWTAFGQWREGGVLVSDVFEGGIFIGADQRLRFVAGPDLAFETVEPPPTNTSGQTLVGSESVTWVGERSFTDRHPYVAFQPARAVATTETATAVTSPGEPTETVTTPGGSGGDGGEQPTTTGAAGSGTAGLSRVLLMVVALGLIGLGVVAAAWINGNLDLGGEATAGEGPGSTTGAGGDRADPAVEQTTLLDDDDRVLQLLENNGGRMKQTEIVDETEWSKSKVSMLLSDMDDAGEISKLRVGRENIISLPGAEPEAAGSPFEDSDEEGA